jgi:acyl-CoA synthetase (AMP-forming)/AMP-acid ligase II
VVSAELLCHNGGELRPFKRSETAELVIAGECVGLGYLGDRSLTEQKFATVPHVDGGMRRCYFSGDLVTYDGANFQFVARVDEQLKVKGYRVEPGDVEAAIAGIDGVRRAAVLGVQKGGVTLLAALYTCQAEAEVTEERVREECARLLPEYMVPSFIHRLNSLPVTENGKIDRSRLSAMVATDSPRPARGGSRES